MGQRRRDLVHSAGHEPNPTDHWYWTGIHLITEQPFAWEALRVVAIPVKRRPRRRNPWARRVSELEGFEAWGQPTVRRWMRNLRTNVVDQGLMVALLADPISWPASELLSDPDVDHHVLGLLVAAMDPDIPSAADTHLVPLRWCETGGFPIDLARIRAPVHAGAGPQDLAALGDITLDWGRTHGLGILSAR